MKFLSIAALAATVAVSPALAQTVSEGRGMAELSFESVDEAGRGYIDQGNMENMRAAIFLSMDADENQFLSETEFLGWDYGFIGIAEEQDKELAYRTALRVVFSFHDLDGDGNISETEHRKSIAADFRRADLNDDAILTADEFINGFSVIVAIRTALKPEE